MKSAVRAGSRPPAPALAASARAFSNHRPQSGRAQALMRRFSCGNGALAPNLRVLGRIAEPLDFPDFARFSRTAGRRLFAAP